jgi:hypothetical protein
LQRYRTERNGDKSASREGAPNSEEREIPDSAKSRTTRTPEKRQGANGAEKAHGKIKSILRQSFCAEAHFPVQSGA